MIGVRRRARGAALQILYELDCTKHGAEGSLARFAAESTLAQEAVTFTEELVHGVTQNKSQLDQLIQRFAPAFPTNQMSVIDRSILRLAIYEMLYQPETPAKVVINEAVELAKRFGTDSSPRLINGVLGSIRSEHSAEN